ncbi:hypothetical protein GCM10007320_09260 [Pseudorhodoferax aquiterrae]|uniref:Uncharacterized protein n=1 Tax=Pseudorhodoferax aquiterrae TaxID=747304 RepID=A0ABQ3FXA0_9BURK|nr:hypothetical protein [Pseudorhodoferax aquiterrae]GHC72991.1 hypothetical protein GCM10007320_09260 [Pseudorhodoferax aquiterrae]
MNDRDAFEAHWLTTRGKRSAERHLKRRAEQPQVYACDSANRHWVTWQAARVGLVEDLCARIKAADDAAADGDYMLDSDDCISVLRGTWRSEPPHA